MITMDENIKSVHDLVLKDRHMRIKIIIENTGLSYYTVHNISQQKLRQKIILKHFGFISIKMVIAQYPIT